MSVLASPHSRCGAGSNLFTARLQEWRNASITMSGYKYRQQICAAFSIVSEDWRGVRTSISRPVECVSLGKSQTVLQQSMGWSTYLSARPHISGPFSDYGLIRLCLIANRTNSAAVWTPALRSAEARWLSTVLTLIDKALAIALLLFPSAMS